MQVTDYQKEKITIGRLRTKLAVAVTRFGAPVLERVYKNVDLFICIVVTLDVCRTDEIWHEASELYILKAAGF